eukprot:3232764-Prymnesium_polylepis.1
MTRERGASRGVNSQKYNQKSKITPPEAPPKTIRQLTGATPTSRRRRTRIPLLRFRKACSQNFCRGGRWS